MSNEELIDNIKSLCKDNNITISQLEKNLGFGSGLISRWSKSDPSLSKIISIADFFDTNIDDIVGRNKEPMVEQENFISLLLQMTENNKITWYDYKDSILPTYTDNFEIFDSVVEIYFSKFENGYFHLVAQYSEEDVKLDQIDIQIYIQPDEESKPIPQDVNFNEAEKLWLLARKNTQGIPDAYKADQFIVNFIELTKKSQST